MTADTLWYSFFNLEPISCSIQGSNCCFLAHIQVSQETGKMFWYFHLFKSVSQFVMFHTVRGFSLVSETEEDIFVEFPCFLYDLANVGSLISASSSFSKPSLDIWKFLVCIILKPSMQDFKHDLTSVGDECSCPVVSTFCSTTLLGNWDEDWLTLSSPVATAESSRFADILNAALWWHHPLGFWIVLLEFHHIP